MLKVNVKENESIDKALKRFKKKLERNGTLREYRNRQFYVKPCDYRRDVVGKAIYREKMKRKNES